MPLSTAAKVLAGAMVGVQAFMYAFDENEMLIRPPGVQEESDFDARCIRCGKCIEACPYESIHAFKSVLSIHTGTPFVDTRSKACRMCHDVPCVAVCPTGALRDVEVPRDINMGTAVIDHEECISYKGLRCEVCYRACPLIDQAITIDYRANDTDDIHSVFAPIINQDQCTGCGLCVERCITDKPSIRIVRQGWPLKESESDDWVSTPRENLSRS